LERLASPAASTPCNALHIKRWCTWVCLKVIAPKLRWLESMHLQSFQLWVLSNCHIVQQNFLPSMWSAGAPIFAASRTWEFKRRETKLTQLFISKLEVCQQKTAVSQVFASYNRHRFWVQSFQDPTPSSLWSATSPRA